MKTFIRTTLLIALAAIALSSCKKEMNEVAPATPVSGNANTEVTSVSYTHATPAHGQACTPGGFGCLLRNEPGASGDRQITYFTPVVNSQGQTGVQMRIEFSNEFPNLSDGILGAEQEGNDATIAVSNAIASALNCQSIEVINKVYYPIYDATHPFGYINLDCYVVYE